MANSLQYNISFAEVATGVVLTKDLKRFLGDGEILITFETLEEAVEYGDSVLAQRPDIEYLIENLEGQLVVFKSIQRLYFLPFNKST